MNDLHIHIYLLCTDIFVWSVLNNGQFSNRVSLIVFGMNTYLNIFLTTEIPNWLYRNSNVKWHLNRWQKYSWKLSRHDIKKSLFHLKIQTNLTFNLMTHLLGYNECHCNTFICACMIKWCLCLCNLNILLILIQFSTIYIYISPFACTNITIYVYYIIYVQSWDDVK